MKLNVCVCTYSSKDGNSSSGQIHCETRIPHYHGHIPGLHNVVGFSPHSSNPWIQEHSENPYLTTNQLSFSEHNHQLK